MQEKLIFMALGGAGEIGMNMYLYAYGPEGQERFILADVGVTFPSADGQPGVDLIMADPDFIAQRMDRLEAIFITHAHEDHIGALALLYPQLRAPVYCRRFTGAVAMTKMEERGQDVTAVHIVDAYPHQVKAGPFSVSFVPMAHSIPESSALLIDSPRGRVFHTGDFKLDQDPIVGDPHDEGLLRGIAKEGIHALVCDSTNVFSRNPGRSEATLRGPIRELIKSSEGLVVATTFSSNIARLKTLAQAATDAGRSVVVLGRSMQRMLGYATSTRILSDFPPIVDIEDSHDIPRENLMVLVTGSQGETRAASAQLANGPFLGLSLRAGDSFLFSSKTIPGNEVGVGRIINKLAEQGVRIIDDSDEAYHVSGHANRPDLVHIHKLFKPNILIPMHGEFRHLKEHKELAEANGIASIIAPNGTAIDLSETEPTVLDHVETGRVYLDGTKLIGAMDGVVLDRVRIANRGHVAVSLVLEDDDLLGVWATARGLADTDVNSPPLDDEIEDEIEQALTGISRNRMLDDDAIIELAERAARRLVRDQIGKKPIVTVLVNRLEA